VAGDQYIVVPKGTTPTEEDWTNTGKTSDHGEALTFDGLTPGVEYDVISRSPGDDTHNPSPASEPTKVTTPKETQTAPAAPNAEADSPTSVVVKPVGNGEEYSIDGGNTWVKPGAGQGEVRFDGLTPGTEYEVISRKAGDDTHYPSPASTPTVVTTSKADQDASTAPHAEADTPSSIVVKVEDSDEEYSIDGGKTWSKPSAGQDEVRFTGLNPGTEYEVISRKAGDDTHNPSPVSDPAKVTTPKAGQTAPAAPNAKADTPTSIVVKVEDSDEEYSIDGGKTWVKPGAGQDEVRFTGLTPGTEYEVIARKAGDDTHNPSPASRPTKVTTPKADQDAPIAPNAEADSSTSVVVKPAADDEEYSVDGGRTWVKPGEGDDEVRFDDLTPGTEYEVISRKAGNGTNAPSANSDPTKVTTPKEDQDAPESAPNAEAESPTSIVVKPVVDGEEYSIDGGKTWVKPGEGDDEVRFEGLTPGAEYEVIARKAGDDTHNPSPAGKATVITMPKEDQAAPEQAPTVIVESATSIVVRPASADEEYSIDGGKTWIKPGEGQDEVRFDYLTPGTTYEVISRKAETDTQNASEPSNATVVTTPEEEIEEPPVPKTSGETTDGKGHWALANLLLSIGTILMAIHILLRKRKDQELDERIVSKAVRLAGLAPALASAITFLLTEKLTGQMKIVDNWTILMAAYLAVSGVVMLINKGIEKKDA